jgi:hypothetical protein
VAIEGNCHGNGTVAVGENGNEAFGFEALYMHEQRHPARLSCMISISLFFIVLCCGMLWCSSAGRGFGEGGFGGRERELG